MFRVTLVTLSLTLVGPAIAADTKFDPDARAKAIAGFLDEEAIAVAHLDVTRLKPDALVGQLADLGNIPAREVGKAKKGLQEWLDRFTKAGGRDIYFVVSLADLHPKKGSPGFLIIPLEEGADNAALSRLARIDFEASSSLKGGKAVFAGSKAALKRLGSLKATERPELARAFAAAGNTALQFLLVPTRDNRRVIEEVMPTFPKEIGGGSSKILTDGLRWAALGIDLPPKMALGLVIQSKDAAAARALHKLLSDLVKAAGQARLLEKDLPGFAKLLPGLLPQVKEDRLILKKEARQVEVVLRQLTPIVARARAAAAREFSMNNLRQMGVALYTYHDTNKAFPAAASYNKQGKPLLSWRVHILPYIEQGWLYKQFHLDEPWDSEHNKKLIALMPKTYSSPRGKRLRPGMTMYLAPVGKSTIFPPGRKGVKITDITDGTANTIALVETLPEKAVVWTRPDDLPYDPKHPRAGLIGKNKEGFLTLFADGSVRILSGRIDPKVLAAYFTRNGGETFPLDH
jgi:hypothetical protein